MNKIFINKDTDMVEQILEVREGEVIQDNYFPNCYMIEDVNNEISTYNLKYNKETEIFEVVEGIPERDDVVVIKQPTAEDFQELKARTEKLEQALNVK